VVPVVVELVPLGVPRGRRQRNIGDLVGAGAKEERDRCNRYEARQPAHAFLPTKRLLGTGSRNPSGNNRAPPRRSRRGRAADQVAR
jgi:hypothetical protein